MIDILDLKEHHFLFVLLVFIGFKKEDLLTVKFTVVQGLDYFVQVSKTVKSSLSNFLNMSLQEYDKFIQKSVFYAQKI